MNGNYETDESRAGSFPATRWSLVLAAAEYDMSASRSEALSTLYSLYWYPLYAFARRQGNDAEQARDATQGFFVRIMEKGYLREFRGERGRFRTFLLAALKHYLSNELDRAKTLKRGGGSITIPINIAFDTAEARYGSEPSDNQTPETLFERQWALSLLQLVKSRLEEECVRTGKSVQFRQLSPFLMGEEPRPSYREIAASLGISEGSAQVIVHRLRRRFRDLLRDEVVQTLANPAEVDAEIRFLQGILYA